MAIDFINKALDLLFPPKCPFCREILTGKAPVCESCLTATRRNDKKSCIICDRPIEEYSHSVCLHCRSEKTYFEHAFIPLLYKDTAKDTVLALKTSHPYYAKGFAFVLRDKILNSPYYTKFDYITFVPQDKKSFKRRGYNQAKLIAEELSKMLDIPCISTLIKTDDGKPQHTLSAAQRRENVKKCFLKTDKSYTGTVLLVDDIYTTGATANYCSRLLRKMGFQKVYLAIAMIRTED